MTEPRRRSARLRISGARVARPTVLIVDDDPAARDVIDALLLPEDYLTAHAERGVEALARLPEVDPDVVLLDVMMPDLDGFEVCRRLKADAAWRHVPVILVTALTQKEHLVRGLDAGADEFLCKPVGGVELRARVRSMLRVKRQMDELAAALELREDLARMIVHDLRNPLSAIGGHAELLLARDDLSDPARRHAAAVHAQTGRLETLVNELLLVSKLEDGRMRLRRDACDPRQLVRDVVEGLRVVAEAKGIGLRVEAQGAPDAWPLDRSLVQRLVENLLTNALRHGPQGSAVTATLDLAANGTRLRLRVADQGPGVPEGQRARIFDKYEVLDPHDRRRFGLGLYLCRTVAEAHGGHVAVGANAPRGAVFTVELGRPGEVPA